MCSLFLTSRLLYITLFSTGGDSLTDDCISPESTMISRLLKYIWSHWDDPIDVRRINTCTVHIVHLVSPLAFTV